MIDGCIRFTQVILSSKQEVLLILKGKSSYSGPMNINQNRMVNQQNYLKHLRAELNSLVNNGKVNKTIKYFNGIPKIVDTFVKQKN